MSHGIIIASPYAYAARLKGLDMPRYNIAFEISPMFPSVTTLNTNYDFFHLSVTKMYLFKGHSRWYGRMVFELD